MSDRTARDAIGIMIVEDDAVTQKSLRLAIESEPALKLLAVFDRVKPAIDWLEKEAPDVLLTDLGLPDGSGIDVIRACVRLRPATDVMVVTISSDEASVVSSIEAGASGYVLKDAGKMNIARAVQDLRSGGAPMSPAIARMVLSRVRGTRAVTAPAAVQDATFAGLTKREAVILELIAQGGTYGQVAKLLSVSVGTVQTHIKNIYSKLAVHSRGEAVFEAHRRGLLQFNR